MGPPPPERRWICYLDNHASIPDRDRFKVLSYNILAESYAAPDRYPYCPSWALDWNYRKQGIIKEILAHNCEVVCLQEVEAHQFTDFFQPELAKAGYAGIFTPKSRAKTMEDWSAVDGCVTFFKRNRFTLVEQHIVEYQSLSIAKHRELECDPEAFARLMTKDNVGLVVILQVNEGHENHHGRGRSNSLNKPKNLIVSNTHIHWNPDHCDVKLMQVHMLLEELSVMTSPKSKWHKVPMVVCGDFNSIVDSGPYELLSTGRIKPKHPDFGPYNYGLCSTQGVQHPLPLSSAYAPIGEPSFTNYTGDFAGVLDYIWYTNESLAVLKVLQPVDEETVKLTRLPNAYMNSDHISVITELFFKRK